MHKLDRSALACFVIAGALMLSACSDDDDNNNSSADASTGDTSIPLDASRDSGGDGAITNDAGDAADAADAAVLTDSQIVGVMQAANTGEINEGQLAQTNASNSDVVAFAAQMVTDHTKSNSDLSTVASQSSLTAATSSIQQQLEAGAQQALTSLQTLSGNAFDTAYVQGQVTTHNQVLTLLDQVLIPQAQTAALQTYLQTTRTTVAMHLQMAKTLQATLADGGASSDAGTDASDASDAGDAMDGE